MGGENLGGERGGGELSRVTTQVQLWRQFEMINSTGIPRKCLFTIYLYIIHLHLINWYIYTYTANSQFVSSDLVLEASSESPPEATQVYTW